jgi:hypothetical protein
LACCCIEKGDEKKSRLTANESKNGFDFNIHLSEEKRSGWPLGMAPVVKDLCSYDCIIKKMTIDGFGWAGSNRESWPVLFFKKEKIAIFLIITGWKVC